MSIFNKLQQLKFPKQFRISSPQLPTDAVLSLERMVQALIEENKGSTHPRSSEKENPRFLADMATGLWRLRIKMVHPDTDEPLEEMSRAFRHLQSVWDAIVQAGIEIKDHTNDPFDPGMSIKAIAFQPTPGLNREMIIETIKPTIYEKDNRIQMGEVIVGTPENQL